MPKLFVCDGLKEMAAKFKINLPKVIFRAFEKSGIEDMNFDLYLYSFDFSGTDKDGDAGELKEEDGKRVFRIRMSDSFETSFAFLFVLFHEIGHIGQFAHNLLRYSDCGKFSYWHGKLRDPRFYLYAARGYEKEADWFAEDCLKSFCREFSIAG